MTYDFIVVGSGATGAMAAQTLTEAGALTAMLDVGFRDEKYADQIPERDFLSIRKEDETQHRYMLGEKFEGIPLDEVKTGAQLTPPRLHVIREVEKWLPLHSDSFFPMESLAYGGLSASWGTGCHVFSDTELQRCGLDPKAVREAYNVIAKRIGVSGERDDAAPYNLGDIEPHQPPPKLDSGFQALQENYRRKKRALNEKGFYLGRPALALLTEAQDDRKATPYHDMEFWNDHGKAAWRSWITVDALRKKNNFHYHEGRLVLRFEEKDGLVHVHTRRTDTNGEEVFSCRKLLLSPGVLGSARIVQRSFAREEEKLPLLCNPYRYMPCLRWGGLGKSTDQLRIGLAQLVMFHDARGDNCDAHMAALFSYRSLLLYRLLREVPLNFRDGRTIMRYLQPAFVIAGIHHPEKPSPSKFLQLKKDARSVTGDVLQATYILSDEERAAVNAQMRRWKWAMRRLGCFPLKVLDPGNGSSIHYAGTLPFSETEKAFHLHPSGRLHGTRNVYLSDGSGFRHLPAKGLTLTLMANAHLSALQALKQHS